MLKVVFILVVASTLSACSDTTPIQMTDEYGRYVGVWQQRFEELKENSLKVDNMLLVINADATAVYRQCEVSQTKMENMSRSTSLSFSFPQAVVTHISDSSITVAQKLAWFGFDRELLVNKPPYQEGPHWYVDIEGKKLTKLSASDSQTKTNWVCPSIDDDN